MSNSPLICTRPFEWFEIHPDGSVFLCCPAWLKRPVGNLLRQSVEEVWNSPVAVELRKSILNGSFHNCSRERCPHLKREGGLVRPLSGFKQGQVRDALAAGRVRLDYLPRKLNLCFDHGCNLACPSCRSGLLASSSAERERAATLAEVIWSELLPHAGEVTLSGFGDPFVAASYRSLMARISRQACPNLKRLYLNSNGQRFNADSWAGLPGLQPLLAGVEISLDAATAETYAVNRPGGDFGRLLDNLAFIAGMGVPLKLSMVVQVNNVGEMRLLVNLAKSFGASVYFSRLVNWGTFSREEFRQRAVHLPGHPAHQDFLQMLGSLQDNPDVDLGNLADMSC